MKTQSIPQWSDTSHKWVYTSCLSAFPTISRATILFLRKNGPFLPWIGRLDGFRTIGLSNESLYDVTTSSYSGSGMVEVRAMGFTCGSIPGVVAKEMNSPDNLEFPQYNISFPKEYLQWTFWDNRPGDNYAFWSKVLWNWFHAGSDVILPANIEDELPTDSIILYTQNSVFDSNDKIGPSVNLPHSNVTFQFLQCSNSLVSQIGQVDAGSKPVIPSLLYPTIRKQNSTWQAYNSFPRMSTRNVTSLLDQNNILIVSQLPLAYSVTLINLV